MSSWILINFFKGQRSIVGKSTYPSLSSASAYYGIKPLIKVLARVVKFVGFFLWSSKMGRLPICLGKRLFVVRNCSLTARSLWRYMCERCRIILPWSLSRSSLILEISSLDTDWNDNTEEKNLDREMSEKILYQDPFKYYVPFFNHASHVAGGGGISLFHFFLSISYFLYFFLQIFLVLILVF